jgi:N-acetylmuramoyl-L-alanine amidase
MSPFGKRPVAQALSRIAGGLGLAVILISCSSRGAAEPGGPPANEGPGRPAEEPRGAPAVAGREVSEPRPSSRPLPEPARLPPVPRVTGSPVLRVQYPRRLDRIAVRDSNFIFGTVGTGDAELRINGVRVPVEANGAFLAWIAVPTPSPDGTVEYLLVASGPGGTESIRHRVRLPPEPFEGPPGTVWIDPASLPAEIERWLTPTDGLEFSVRATPGISVSVALGDARLALQEAGSGLYRGSLLIREILDSACDARDPAAGSEARDSALSCGPGRVDTLEARVVATDGSRQVVERRRYPLTVLDPEALPIVALVEKPDPVHGSSGVVPGRPTPYGPYRWLFPDGARAQADLRLGDRVRIRLSPDLETWVAADHVVLGEAAGILEARVGWIEAEERSGGVTVVRIPLDQPVPAHVEEPEDRTLRLTLYGALGETERMAYGRSESTGTLELESLAWAQRPGSLYELTVRLARPVWGYRLTYTKGGTGRPELLLELRHPPIVDAAAPLKGRRIAVDAGHPPVGSFGPTGFFEGDANLAIAHRLAALLEEAGAEPILTRRDTLPLGLYERTGLAVRAGADLFVSIHNNALPDGIRPFGEEGSSTYYYHPHSRTFAQAVQTGMLASMGLQDLGMRWGSFAVARLPWMPSILAEGAFMMFPHQEAALKTREFQDAYARGVLWGIEEFLSGYVREEGSQEE